MKSLYWNARGMANAPTRLALKRLLNVNKPDFCFIAEPWISFDAYSRGWFHRLGYKLFASNVGNDLLPNLWCFCLHNLQPDVLEIDDQLVAFSITYNNIKIGITAVYASIAYIHRRLLWNKLQNLQNQHLIPWCFMGDFNSILGASEHKGHCMPARALMEDFQLWTNNNHLIHLPTLGAFYTWRSGRSGTRNTERRLDRCICNERWMDIASSVNCSTLIKNQSDHYSILLDFQLTNHKFFSQFKFLKMWSLHETCKDVIQDSWKLPVIGCPMFVLSKKLQTLKIKLKCWNKEVFDNIHGLVKTTEASLQTIQAQIQTLGHTELLVQQEKQAQHELDLALNKEELFWFEKSKVRWHLEGDTNNAYFHKVTKIKNTTKLITRIKDGDNLIIEPDQIASHAVNYFQNVFCTNFFLQDHALVEDAIPEMITAEVNNILTKTPTSEEIKFAVFSLNFDSAPGPDGFGASFFQTYWEIIKDDVINAVLQFFNTGWILPNYNGNTMVLIPKTTNADTMDQFRPIVMANFKFKIISKIIADRLAQIMPIIISKEQRGFIQGRNIKDCLCLASEAINMMDKRAYGGNLALKVDISKAFDTLEWIFLLKVLRKFGFSEKFCDWIKAILHSATISININGTQQGYFKCSKGVRQGDPLSPIVLCIAEDVLSRSLSKLVEQGKLEQMSGTRKYKVPSHALYADDIMVFCKGKRSCMEALVYLFTKYAQESGQMVNPNKSTVFAGSISATRMSQLIKIFGFKHGTLPFTYLGVPIFKGKPKVRHLQPIVNKIRAKLSAWKASLLSIAGRVQLVKSVIQSMLTHSITVYNWPTSLLKDLEKSIRNFIWSGDTSKRKLVTVAWKKLCRPLDQGGLGIKSLIHLNTTSNLKLCWNMLQSNQSWASLLTSRVIRNREVINHHIFFLNLVKHQN